MCCVEGNIYLVGGGDRVTEFNPYTKTWRNMPSLQQSRHYPSVCTLDNKIFVLGGSASTCEMLDLSDDDPHWRNVANINRGHKYGSVVLIEKKIYVLSGESTIVEVYDVDQGILIEY